jgi:hypothetical protein
MSTSIQERVLRSSHFTRRKRLALGHLTVSWSPLTIRQPRVRLLAPEAGTGAAWSAYKKGFFGALSTTALLTLITSLQASASPAPCVRERRHRTVEQHIHGSGKWQRSWQRRRRRACAGPPLRAPPRRAGRVGGVHGRRPRRVELQQRQLAQGQAVPRRRRARSVLLATSSLFMHVSVTAPPPSFPKLRSIPYAWMAAVLRVHAFVVQRSGTTPRRTTWCP